MSYAGIIIDISHDKVDRIFTYRVPKELEGQLSVGSAVTVPFGKGNTIRTGYVAELSDTYEAKDRTSVPVERLKFIQAKAARDLSAENVSVQLAAWMKKTYGSTMIAALKTVLPVNKKEREKVQKHLRLKMEVTEATAFYHACERKHQKAKARLLKEMLQFPDATFPCALMTGKLSVSMQTVNRLRDEGVIEILTDTVYRNPAFGKALAKEPVTLSQKQQEIVTGVLEDFDAGRRGVSLLHGVTGSGKTEVYIGIIKGMVKRGYQAVVLIPEIALTYQTLMRFYRHFGERVSVMNSTLSKGERFDQFERARRAEIDVIIGPRSALFTPFPRLGLIIIDEEHETTYKSEQSPKYHARETAIALSSLLPEKASVLLGSATPSVNSYAAAMKGEYKLYTLTERLTGGTLASVQVADLREELKNGNRSIFSRALYKRMEERLLKKEQTMLFINRRGLGGFVSCRYCGHVFSCPHCDVSLSAHSKMRLVCHYCGHEERATKVCPSCGKPYVSAFRAGTEQVVTQLQKVLPAARVLRMDADTTMKKGSYEEILTAFAEGEADILVGTQMIVKGHDFPNVTLMGILAADMSLNAEDYMAAERTFQLLTQAAGRAGRGEQKGEVIIQTYRPEHYSIQAAAAQDYERFFAEEIAYRKLLYYPPYAHLLAVQLQAKEEAALSTCANRIRAHLELQAPAGSIFLGPTAAQVAKVHDIYRMAVYVKHESVEALTSVKDRAEDFFRERPALQNAVQMQFDLDPVRGF